MKKMFITIFVVVALLLTVSPTAANAASNKQTHRAVSVVKQQKGDPYRYGATGPNAFDCSGLVYYSYRRAGIRVARTSDQQASQTRRIQRRHMRPGDLMFFYNSGGVYHVAVYVGWHNGRRHLVHSPKPGTRVHDTVPWTNRWFVGTYRR